MVPKTFMSGSVALVNEVDDGIKFTEHGTGRVEFVEGNIVQIKFDRTDEYRYITKSDLQKLQKLSARRSVIQL